METLIYVANVLYLLSYGVRDMLHLRLLTITAATCLALYFASRPEPLMEVVCWNAVFIVLNAVQIGRILRSRQRDALATATVPRNAAAA